MSGMEHLMAMRLSDAGFPTRLVNAMDAQGVTTVSDYLEMSDVEILRTPNVGKLSMGLAKARLESLLGPSSYRAEATETTEFIQWCLWNRDFLNLLRMRMT